LHPFDDLSAYMDEALSPQARASVQAHLDTCAICPARLSELRSTARLIAALPMPVPSRSLVPRVSVPFWLAPLRTLSTFASGAAVLLFLAASLIAFFPRAQSAATAGAAPNALSAPEASSAGAAGAPTSQDYKALSPPPAAAGSARADAVASPTPADTTKEIGRQDSSGSFAVTRDQSGREATSEPLAFLISPWLWLALALAFAAVSFAVGRRLRST
jgi:anti-sigma factor RsiW